MDEIVYEITNLKEDSSLSYVRGYLSTLELYGLLDSETKKKFADLSQRREKYFKWYVALNLIAYAQVLVMTKRFGITNLNSIALSSVPCFLLIVQYQFFKFFKMNPLLKEIKKNYLDKIKRFNQNHNIFEFNKNFLHEDVSDSVLLELQAQLKQVLI